MRLHPPISTPSDAQNELRVEAAAGIPKLLVVGAINVDVTAHVCGALDASVASTVVGSDEPPSFTQGGRGFNQAVACARLGLATHLVAKIGNDLLARRVIEEGLQEASHRMPLDVTSVLRAEQKEAKTGAPPADLPPLYVFPQVLSLSSLPIVFLSSLSSPILILAVFHRRCA